MFDSLSYVTDKDDVCVCIIVFVFVYLASLEWIDLHVSPFTVHVFCEFIYYISPFFVYRINYMYLFNFVTCRFE